MPIAEQSYVVEKIEQARDSIIKNSGRLTGALTTLAGLSFGCYGLSIPLQAGLLGLGVLPAAAVPILTGMILVTVPLVAYKLGLLRVVYNFGTIPGRAISAAIIEFSKHTLSGLVTETFGSVTAIFNSISKLFVAASSASASNTQQTTPDVQPMASATQHQASANAYADSCNAAMTPGLQRQFASAPPLATVVAAEQVSALGDGSVHQDFRAAGSTGSISKATQS